MRLTFHLQLDVNREAAGAFRDERVRDKNQKKRGHPIDFEGGVRNPGTTYRGAPFFDFFGVSALGELWRGARRVAHPVISGKLGWVSRRTEGEAWDHHFEKERTEREGRASILSTRCIGFSRVRCGGVVGTARDTPRTTQRLYFPPELANREESKGGGPSSGAKK